MTLESQGQGKLGLVEFAQHWPAEHCGGKGWQMLQGELKLGPMSAGQIAKNIGSPIFIYSTEIMRAQVDRLRAILPSTCDLHYAVKANPNSDVLRFLMPLLDGADVASIGELELAMQAGFSAHSIGFAGPGKTVAEISSALQLGVTITAESLHQIEMIGALGIGNKKIAIRINPNYELRGSGMRMAGGSSAFGIDEEQVPQAISLAHTFGLSVVGFHVYAGSQNLDGKVIAETIVKATIVATGLVDQHLMSTQQAHPWRTLLRRGKNLRPAPH
jgi:diaminopimelate decarboxylase